MEECGNHKVVVVQHILEDLGPIRVVFIVWYLIRCLIFKLKLDHPHQMCLVCSSSNNNYILINKQCRKVYTSIINNHPFSSRNLSPLGAFVPHYVQHRFL